MDRRHFLRAAGATVLGAWAMRASAAGSCFPQGNGQICDVGVDLRDLMVAAQPQFQSQWCWAACIATLFAHHGHPVQQQRIVSEVYGSPANMPAMAGSVIAQQLNRRWRDDRGQVFQARLGPAYDFDAGYVGIQNAQIIRELIAGNPLVMGAGSHAVVLTALRYFENPWGVQIVGGMAFDPWPGRGVRPLAPAELVPMHLGGALRFLATARVS